MRPVPDAALFFAFPAACARPTVSCPALLPTIHGPDARTSVSPALLAAGGTEYARKYGHDGLPKMLVTELGGGRLAVVMRVHRLEERRVLGGGIHAGSWDGRWSGKER